MILGTALLSATLVGFTLKMNEQRQKTAFYVAEAGLDEVYAYLGEEVENAIQYSKNVVVATELVNHPEYNVMNTETYNQTLRNHFIDGYKKYFDVNKATLEDRMKTKLISHNLDQGVSGESIGVVNAEITKTFQNDGYMEVTFTTKVLKKDLSKNDTNMFQTIKANLRVDVPNYETPYIHTMKKLEIKRNALFDQAIAIDGNFYAYDGAVTINGNLFAHGKDINLDLIDTNTVGGVFVGGKNPINGQRQSGSLTVLEDLVTERYARINSATTVSKSELVVNKDLFCNSLVMADSYENLANTNGHIIINGNASVMDDTELNADYSDIKIAGNYFGFSKGSTSSENHDQSSSIIVNTENLGTGKSKMQILGGGADKVFPDNEKAIKGVYIAGTVYVDDGKSYAMLEYPAYGTVTLIDDGHYTYVPGPSSVGKTADTFKVNATGYGVTQPVEVKVTLNGMNKIFGYAGSNYQTGDSISIIGNYLAYGKTLDQKLDQIPKFYNSDQDFAAYNKLTEDYFDTFEPLDVVNWKNPGREIMNVNDKAKYSNYVYKQEPGVFLLGDEGLELKNVIYSLGTYISREESVSSLKNDKIYDENMGVTLLKLGKEYNYRIRNMGDAQVQNYLNETYNSYLGIQNWLKTGWSETTGTLSIVKHPSTTDLTLAYVKNKSGTNANEAVILVGSNPDTTQVDALKGILAAKGVSYTLFDVSSPVKGLILAHSDVYCFGTINYTGLIATEGNVYCLDERLKTFNNPTQTSSDKIIIGTSQVGNYVTDVAIKGLVETVGKTEPGYWFRQDATWTKKIEKLVKGTEIPVESGSTGYIGNAKNAIRMTKWEKIDELVSP